MMTKIDHVIVYWDSQDPKNEGWAWKAARKTEEGDLDSVGSGPVDVGADGLDEAIAAACHELDLDLTPSDFAREPLVDGGFAIWTKEVD